MAAGVTPCPVTHRSHRSFADREAPARSPGARARKPAPRPARGCVGPGGQGYQVHFQQDPEQRRDKEQQEGSLRPAPPQTLAGMETADDSEHDQTPRSRPTHDREMQRSCFAPGSPGSRCSQRQQAEAKQRADPSAPGRPRDGGTATARAALCRRATKPTHLPASKSHGGGEDDE